MGEGRGAIRSEAEEAERVGYAETRRADKEQPLSEVVGDHDHKACMRNLLYEHVPCEDEVRKNK